MPDGAVSSSMEVDQYWGASLFEEDEGHRAPVSPPTPLDSDWDSVHLSYPSHTVAPASVHQCQASNILPKWATCGHRHGDSRYASTAVCLLCHPGVAVSEKEWKVAYTLLGVTDSTPWLVSRSQSWFHLQRAGISSGLAWKLKAIIEYLVIATSPRRYNSIFCDPKEMWWFLGLAQGEGAWEGEYFDDPMFKGIISYFDHTVANVATLEYIYRYLDSDWSRIPEEVFPLS